MVEMTPDTMGHIRVAYNRRYWRKRQNGLCKKKDDAFLFSYAEFLTIERSIDDGALIFEPVRAAAEAKA